MPARISREISPNDAMFALDQTWSNYLSIALSALRCIRRSMTLAGKQEIRSLLDLGCGHGRVLRVLKVAFPHARLTACDLDLDGVEFCARELGAIPVASHVNAGEIDLAGPFDLVWSGSLFTHIDAPRWSEFLALIESVLEPAGLLVFTVHGRQMADGYRMVPDPLLPPADVERMLRGYDEVGFGYSKYPGTQDWGDSVVTQAWVTRLVEEATALRLVDYDETGWAGAQDVVTCLAEPCR